MLRKKFFLVAPEAWEIYLVQITAPVENTGSGSLFTDGILISTEDGNCKREEVPFDSFINPYGNNFCASAD